MEHPNDEPPFELESMEERRDDRKDSGDLGDLVDAVDVTEVFDLDPCSLDACRPGWLDLGCFDVSDCGGGLDCVSFDCSF